MKTGSAIFRLTVDFIEINDNTFMQLIDFHHWIAINIDTLTSLVKPIHSQYDRRKGGGGGDKKRKTKREESLLLPPQFLSHLT